MGKNREGGKRHQRTTGEYRPDSSQWQTEYQHNAATALNCRASKKKNTKARWKAFIALRFMKPV